MTNRCYECGKCCLDTEMILSRKDINIILEHLPNDAYKEKFYFKNEEGFYQLINIDNHCVFFEPFSKTCKIYKFRPQGCRFYPLIYDPEKKICLFDNECPRTELFYKDKEDFQKTCQRIKLFLKKNIHLDIL